MMLLCDLGQFEANAECQDQTDQLYIQVSTLIGQGVMFLVGAINFIVAIGMK